VRGTLGCSTKGYKTINNGIENKVISSSEDIPEGFVLGRLKTSNEKYKEAAHKRSKEIYNNGVEQISLLSTDVIPEGFVKGKLTKDIRKKSRDSYYRELGYVPLKELREKYGINWYVYLENIDKIVLSEPYVYVNEKEIPRIEEYISTNHSKGTSKFEQEVEDYIK